MADQQDQKGGQKGQQGGQKGGDRPGGQDPQRKDKKQGNPKR